MASAVLDDFTAKGIDTIVEGVSFLLRLARHCGSFRGALSSLFCLVNSTELVPARGGGLFGVVKGLVLLENFVFGHQNAIGGC